MGATEVRELEMAQSQKNKNLFIASQKMIWVLVSQLISCMT